MESSHLSVRSFLILPFSFLFTYRRSLSLPSLWVTGSVFMVSITPFTLITVRGWTLGVFDSFSPLPLVGLHGAISYLYQSGGFIKSHSFYFLNCEVMMMPMDWRYITGIKFTGRHVDLEIDISPTTVQTLLGFIARDKVFKGKSIHLGTLVVKAI